MARKKVDPSTFEKVKKLINAGWTNKEIAATTSISDVTASRIRRSATFADYETLTKASHPTMDAPVDLTSDLVVTLKDIARSLDLIYNALVRLNKED